MKYAVEPVGGRWRVFARTRGGGFVDKTCDALQDAYALLFLLGAFEARA